MSIKADPGAAAARRSPSTLVAVCNQKGGVGKTMMSLALAQHTAAASGRALVVDVDPQATAHDVTATLEDPGYDVIAETNPAMLAKLGQLREHDTIYADCPGSLEGMSVLAQVLDHADYVLIPYDHQVESVLPTVRTMRMVRERGVPCGVVVNQMPGGSLGRSTYEAAAATIEQAGGTVLRSYVRRYRAWGNSLQAGQPLTRWREGNASALREDVARVSTELLLAVRRGA